MRNKHKDFKGGYSSERKNGKFSVSFNNPITCEKEYLGMVNSQEEAINTYGLHQHNFYKQHPYLLPKGITCNNLERNKLFFKAQLNVSTTKIVYLGGFNSVQEAEQHRKEVIMNMF